MIVQPTNARQKVRPGDFVLANEKIAVYIEAEGESDGYLPFGGEILALDTVGEDGRPRGSSQYGESLITLSRQAVAPDRVTVIADGSDGKAAIVRASGVLKNVPFLDTFAPLMPTELGFPAALDYVLEPGAERVLLRLSLANTQTETVDLTGKQFAGFFHAHRGRLFTEANAYAAPKGETPWVAWDAGDSAFLVRAVAGQLRAELEVSGFQMFSMKSLSLEACQKTTVDYIEMIPGAPGIDGLLEAKRRALGEPPWRAIQGTLRETGAAPLANALVHATAPDGRYLTRARTDANGAFSLHVPPGEVSLTPTLAGWAVPAPTKIAADATRADLALPPRATIAVTAKDATTNEALPVRVQILPSSPIAQPPEAWGVLGEAFGRLYSEYPMDGKVSVPVPPGQHRVVVTRGYEYEAFDTPALAEEGKTTSIDASLLHSVDSTGVMCADFHVHSYFSADAPDEPDLKVKGAVADGLEIPVSSEHEWIIDFRPIIARLGVAKYATSLPSEELTTFTWGHFGVIPKLYDENATNNGAVAWVGKKPADIFKQVNALPEKPVLVVNHPYSDGFQGYFGQAAFDRASTTGTPELWSDEFAAIEVFNGSDFEDNRVRSVASWFALLNAGKTYWAVGNSDSHRQRTSPVGYPRNCLAFGHDDPQKLTPENVRDVLKAGASVVNGGLSMKVAGPDGTGPGGKSQAGKYTVTIAAPSWLSASSLEVIVDGVTVETRTLPAPAGPGPGKKWVVDVDVAPTQSKARHWVVFHAKGPTDLAPLHPGRRPFAVSNPIFF
jgi:hypothetical protein